MSKENIGTRIKKFRKENKITQDSLAKSLGYYDKSVISHIEKGDADMPYDKILLMLRTYDLDANKLFFDQIKKNIDELAKEHSPKDRIAVYIHGLHGSYKEEQEYYYLKSKYDVVGLDYQDANPWELKDIIVNEFRKITKDYQEVIVIANSIGAFYTYEYLKGFDIKHAFFISPIADMHKIVFDLMMRYGVSREELEEKKIIELDNGQTLSYDFYKYVLNYENHWNVPTDILYGEHDELVYIENIADFLANHPNSKLTIKQGAGHYFHTDEEKEFIKNWMLYVINNIEGDK